jgi:NAD(P)-dependent dehydrogenase (short-subunit alcohol dehydrogenase family)
MDFINGGMNMKGKICMITGANSGIGKATALGLAGLGAHVIMVCRTRERGDAAMGEIKTLSGNDAVDLFVADLASQNSIRQLVKEFNSRHEELHVLINNAGIYRTKRTLTGDNVEIHFAVNYLAPFLMTNLLLETLKASAPARIINVAGDYHRKATIDFEDLMTEKDYSAGMANNKAKLGLVLFTYELARRLRGTAVTANCLHPGAVKSDSIKKDPDAPSTMLFLYKFMKPFFASPEKGAETSIYLASSPDVEGVTGKYFIKKNEVESSPESYDQTIAGRLWEVSKQLTGLDL